MQITIKDIARMADVAESTVSRALNNKKGVGEKTRKKIMKIAEKYNYRPNRLARGLVSNRTNMIALILSDMDNQSYIDIVKNIEIEAERNNYQVILCNTNGDLEKEKSYLNLLESNQVDGAIFIGGGLVGQYLLNASFEKSNKIVLINRLSEEGFFPTVLTDNGEGTYRAVKHLLDGGYKKIALVTGDLSILTEEEKFNGYKNALKESDINFDKRLVVETSGKRREGYNAFTNLINKEVIPDAFIITLELLTIGLVEAVKTGGYMIPDDFAVIGSGDNILTSAVDPPLTVIAEPVEEIARLAFENLMNILNDNIQKSSIKVLTPHLIIRKSSK
ncbi:MAG: LacI family DNA-binding transcriptional regulator [Bacillota bacterium]